MHTAPISINVWKSGFLLSNLLFQISGVLNDTKSTFCSSSTSSLPSSQKASTKRIAVVLRGECKFAKKAENAAKDGYKGLIILDTETNTNVERISGVRSLLTDNIAVVFLLRNEANILQELLSKSPNRTATLSGIILAQSSHYGAVCCVVWWWCTKWVTTAWLCWVNERWCPTRPITLLLSFLFIPLSDSSTFSWFKKSTTTTTTTTMSSTAKPPTTTTSYSNMIFSKLIPSGNIFNIHNTKRKADFKSSGGSNIQDASVMMILEDGEKGIVDVTPLTIGSISVGVVVGILLFISIITLIVSKIRRHRRRRTQHTRCQQAIRWLWISYSTQFFKQYNISGNLMPWIDLLVRIIQATLVKMEPLLHWIEFFPSPLTVYLNVLYAWKLPGLQRKYSNAEKGILSVILVKPIQIWRTVQCAESH